ncbi:MAG: SDR family NAD(P)-dependent oxidoreductase [Aureliella sp.]
MSEFSRPLSRSTGRPTAQFDSASGATGNRSSKEEPLAIIGIGCRFPGGADSWQDYWHLLESGTDAISETPDSRWNLKKFYEANETLPGKTQSKWGGYVRNIERFDPQLFGISPREAASMDPQQRMLLEVAYRAMEDAGHPTQALAGQRVSVFVGISSFDYAVAGLSFQDRGVIDAYSNTGGSSSIAANRISYCFDLRGPSVAVDTACSSSLVALHMACESIWRGDAEMAMAGGVNALLMPDFYVAFSQLGVLSPDGRCKTFDSRANGYVRSEGAGMVMLKPLSAALRDKDEVYAVIRATALNQDGRTPGMTVPSQEAQELLIRTACEKAQIEPQSVQYVEAHGTGTPVGDPIEAGALGAVFGADRGDDADPCVVGSVKTNIGHLEAGAGIASVIKVALSLHHKRIPAHLHLRETNSAIDFERLNLRVPTSTESWNSTQPRIAGVNGFGYGGANAHVILEEAPEAADRKVTSNYTGFSKLATEEPTVAPVLLPLSAKTASALPQMAGDLAEWLGESTEYPIAELGGYLAHRRSHSEVRTTVCANTRSELVSELRSLAEGSPAEYAERFASNKVAKGVVFVCSGQGPQWWAMGRGLIKYSPAFRTVIKRCDHEFSKYGDWSLLEELTRPESESRMQKTSIAQPSIFAIQVALAAVWESWGIRPAAVVGHSVGEIAAAYLSGALSWNDACCVAFHRGRTMDLASSHGAMLAAGLSPDEVPEWIRGMEHEVSIAAMNGPTSVTISGDKDAISNLADRLEDKGVFCRRLAVEYAFHSPQMDPVESELLKALAHIQPRTTHTPLISTVTGGLVNGTEVGAEYWWQNVRQAVRFSDAMSCLAEEGYAVAIEIGPHPVLAYSINECFQAAGKSVRCVSSLNRQQDDLQCITKSLGHMYSLGFDISWTGFYNQPIRKVPAPRYPFQTQECWSESYESLTTRLADSKHPLLGEASDDPGSVWQARIDLKLQGYLSDHQVRGGVVYPAAAMIETTLAAVHALRDEESKSESTSPNVVLPNVVLPNVVLPNVVLPNVVLPNAASRDDASPNVRQAQACVLERLQFHSPCTLSESRPQWIESRFDDRLRQCVLSYRECGESVWSRLSTMGISNAKPNKPLQIERDFSNSLESIEQRCDDFFDRERLYAYCDAMGLRYGERFQGILSGRRRVGESVVEVDTVNLQVDDSDYFFHPALLDACFHSMIAADPNFDHTIDGLYLPVEIERFTFYRRPEGTLRVHTSVLSKTDKFLTCDVRIFNSDGSLCATIDRFQSMRVAGGVNAERTEDLVYGYRWREESLEGDFAPEAEPGAPLRTLVFMDEGPFGKELVGRLVAKGGSVLEAYRHDSQVPQSAQDFVQVNPEDRDSFLGLLRQAQSKLGGLPDQIVYFWGIDCPANIGLDEVTLQESADLTALAPLHLIQAWEQVSESMQANFAVVTSGAQSSDGHPEPLEVAQGPLVGFGRVIASEYSKLRTKLIDLPFEFSPQGIDDLEAELLSQDDEDEIMWREGRRYVHRFEPQAGAPASEQARQELACQLRVGASSGIEELRYQTKPNRELEPGQVEIEVYAAGLNFSDVMKALDLYPGLPDGPVDLGAECSGRIARVAEGSNWQLGDEVIAVAPGAFGTRVVVNEALVARKPSCLTHEQASAIPVAFLTAEYALNECARIREGDSVLIHSASGGVGIAAMQLAKLAEVRIFATAGNDEKRKFVRDFGADYVMDSRSLDFAEETLRATDGEGVDAVLNSLPGEAIPKGISTLKTGGRFLEIGKRDIYGDTPLGLYPFRNNLALHAIDLDQLFKQQPGRMGAMLERIVERFEDGVLQPLPVKRFSVDETVAAYRFMQQGKHIGKVVVTYEKEPAEIHVGPYDPIAMRADATYWLVGGLGGFGLEIAKWYVRCGAKHLVLSGRSATPRPEAREALAEFEQAGVHVEVIPADVTKASEVQRVLSTIDRDMPPLRGVVHTAMVLEDKLLVDLDRPTLERVLWPKMLGGWNLHEATTARQLDHFVLFSSLSSVFGHAGQANYSAANALLDSLAYYRRSQGLPATVMNWGHLGEVGYLAEREQLGERLERQGVLSFSVEQATDCLEYALQNRSLQLSVLRMDWSVWRGLGITNRVSPRFAHLLQNSATASADAGSDRSAESLRRMDSALRSEQIETMVCSKAGLLLGIAADDIPRERALLELGLDSLMAVEMRNWIESQLEISLPISVLMRSENLTEVAIAISDLMESSVDSHKVDSGSAAEMTEVISADDAEQLLGELDDLGDSEVNDLLEQMLRDDQ